jgi:hypothetical protein
VAEFLYDAVAQFEKAKSLTIDNIDLAFFKDIYSDAATKSYEGSEFDDILASMTTYADGFVSVVQVSVRHVQCGFLQLTKLLAIYAAERLACRTDQQDHRRPGICL